ncbi:phosphopantetheine-binding protein [Actinoplanes subtropicus]|uniref:phosphopantetheine-binding protein n=1 Tax=Actinoplanes subtropicus TaxID=543632 RepID=UPI00068D5255|nr:phosphopantetheine-binding protein [Actinoplanes subtropicus]
MTGPTDNLVAEALDWVRAHRVDRETMDTPVTAETDLLTVGVLDSLGFVQLMTFLAERTGRTVDLVDLDFDDLATVRSLCRLYTSKEGADVG